MSTTVTDPARDRAGGTTRARLSTPKHTVTSACMASPATWPVSESTPLGTSTATTGTPDASTARTAPAAGSRTAPAPPMPRIPSRTRSAAAMTAATCGSSQARIRVPAARAAPAPSTCMRSGSPIATVAIPRRARWARAHRASPPLFPEPTRAATRAPRTRPRPPRTRSRQTPARAVDARCMSTGSGTPAPASARRTTSTEQIGRICTSLPPAYHMGPTHAEGQPGLSVPPVTLVTCATVPPGTASEVAESRPLRYFPNQGGSGGPRYHWDPTGHQPVGTLGVPAVPGARPAGGCCTCTSARTGPDSSPRRR